VPADAVDELDAKINELGAIVKSMENYVRQELHSKDAAASG
jgi:hypothetical protein